MIGALTICFGESAKAQAPGGVSSGMVLWLKANQGTSTTTDNQPVSFWNDQSGNGNNAIQLTPLSQPRYKKQAFNGNPAIEFNVGNKFMNVNLSQIDNHDYTVYVVAKRTGSTPNGYLFGVQQTVPNPGLQFGYDTNTSLKLEQYGNSITQPVTGYNSATETPVILSAMFNTLTGKSMSEVEEGVLVTGSNSNTASYLQGAQGVIGRGNSTTGFKGLISEIIAYNRILTAAERKDIESYLAIKYGITLPNGANKFYADAAFSHDVAGIGRDVAAQGLDQQSSKSENADGILYVDNASDLQDGEYFVWGNDNRSHSFIPEYTNCAVSDIYDRSWKINETGEVGTVKITYNVSGVTGIDPNDIVLLIDDDGDGFAEENPIYGSYAAPNKVFSGLNFQTGYRFTIAVGVSRYYAVASGNASGAVWSKTPGGTPQVVGAFCDKIDLIVQSGFTITNDLPDLSCNDFTLEAGATFNLGTNQLSLSGDGVFFGTLNASSGTIACNGVAPQAIAGGSLDFYNWNCINPSFVTITATQVSVHGYLSVTAGELKTTGKLTMASDATSTGMIGPLTTGNLTGTVTVMRYHNALAGGWVNLCSPIQNKTIMDWDDDLITTGFTGSDFPS
ncbi:MAG: hypothetical protein OEW26_08825, partial [Nitrospirota bacterium]|nr:hypothetical protein [Nitrospirota bacterium]